MTKPWMLLMVIGVFFAACAPADSDKCPSGFTFDEKTQTCIKEKLDAAVPAVDVAAAATAEAGVSGLGKACTSSKDCTDNYKDVDFCVTVKSQCTIKDCLTKGCPSPLICCDCSSVAMIGNEDICTSSDNTVTLTGLGCTCK